MNYAVIILGAGSGSRMNLGYNKMLYELNHHPVITLSIKKFLHDENCKQIIIVVNEHEKEQMSNLLQQANLLDNRCMIVNGGKERQHSVYNGLMHVESDIVLVHDGARPFISQRLISTLVEKTLIYGCSIPAVKVKDTIKQVENALVVKTLPRHELYAVQTPQAVKSDLLKEVHQLAKKEHFIGTDEASLVEKYSSSSVHIIESSYDNIKITTQEDLMIANYLYKKYYETSDTHES